MSIEILSLVLLFGLFGLMAVGVPLSFAAGALAIILAYINFGWPVLALAHSRIFSIATEYVLLSVPMFILMACLIERSTMARDLFDGFNSLMGRLRGGVALITLVISVMLASMSGIIGGEIVLLGLVALPQMLRLNYDPKLAIGVVCAGGSLGTMIPPSIVLIVFGLTAQVSVHQLFLASFVPGLLLAGVYLAYILIRCYMSPNIAPLPDPATLPPFDRWDFARKIVPTIALIIVVFVSIYGGITSITEAAAIAVAVTIVIIAMRGELNFRMFRGALNQTFRACGIILWVTFGAAVLISVYNLSGGQRFVTSLITGLDISPTVTILLMMVVLLFLGLFMDWIGILLLTMPIFVPIVAALGYSPVWFGVIFSITMQVAFLTPPFGPAAFYLKSVAPKEITLPMIFASLWPFMLLQLFVLALLLAFPEIALWLPRQFS